MSNSVTTAQIDLTTLAFDIAQNHVGARVPVTDILDKHGVTLADFLQINASPSFQQALRGYADEFRKNGVGFRLKARVQAEELLKSNWRIIHDPATPPGVAVKAIENTVRWADLEPRKDIDTSSRPSITVNIDLGTSQESVTIDTTPVPPSLPPTQ